MLLTWDRYASRWTKLHGGADPGYGTRLAYRVGRVLARLGVRPAGVTALGLALSVLAPLTVRQSPAAPLYAAALVAAAAAADATDGAVALVANRVTRLGYVYDSVADRLGEAAWLTALWLLGTPTWLAVLAGAVTWLHEYLRARATAAGMREVRLAMVAGRPARAAVTVTGLGLAGLAGLAARPLTVGTTTLAGTVWLLFGLVGLGQLLVAVHVAFRHRAGEPEAP